MIIGPALPASPSERRLLILAMFILLVLTGVAFLSRPVTPIDETRYLGVAWEMWLRGDFLVPWKNGAPYSHKPPLMMWIFQAGWVVFGVNEWWPRLVSPLFSAGNLLLTMALARRLWPDRVNVGGPAVLVLASCLLWAVFSTAAMFDIILAFFTLLGMHGTLIAAAGDSKRGFVWLGVAIGLGVLAKGPVILLHVLPAALLAPWWKRGLRWSQWFGGVLVAVLLGAALALSWAIPAGIEGGEAYRQAIFFGQTANRMVESFAHRRPLWWYLPLLPALFFPWLLWPGLWRSLSNYLRRELDGGGRFCLAWFLPVLVAFSFISGKQPAYLIPLFPAFALLAARAMVNEQRVRGLWLPALAVIALGAAVLSVAAGWIVPAWVGTRLPESWTGLLLIAAAMVGYLSGRRLATPLPVLAILGATVLALLQLGLRQQIYPAYDVRPMALAIRQAQDSGHVVAHLGDYHDQYQFAGRLPAPLVLLAHTEALKAWLAGHPDARVVVYPKDIGRLEGIGVIASQPYLAGAVALLDARSALTALATPKMLD